MRHYLFNERKIWKFYIFRRNKLNLTKNYTIKSGYLASISIKYEANHMFFATVIAEQTDKLNYKQTPKFFVSHSKPQLAFRQLTIILINRER